MSKNVTVTFTPEQARVVWNTLDGQADAGACEGGNTPREAKAIQGAMAKLTRHFDKFKGVKFDDF